MIIITLSIKVPSSKKEDIINTFDSFVGPVSVQPGCLSVKLYSEVNNNNEKLLLMEIWNSRTDLDRYVRSDEFRKILAMLDMADEQPEITFHTISSTEGFGLVERLRSKKEAAS